MAIVVLSQFPLCGMILNMGKWVEGAWIEGGGGTGGVKGETLQNISD